MLDIIYYFNIFGCLTMEMALLLIQTAPQLINPHYRNAKRFPGYCIDYRGSVQCAYPLQQGTGERCRNICNARARCGTVAGGAFYFYRADTFSFTIRLPAKYFATPLPDIVFCGTLSINDTSIS
ncbi:hypothetical protein NXW74_06500 [Bacteroides ovatus]|nr:hypothetical protein NXW64_07150 [Bacteroides ovatus]UVR10617.1 hypothetical protein NXW74_06500 [Bacteroides ovatus]